MYFFNPTNQLWKLYYFIFNNFCFHFVSILFPKLNHFLCNNQFSLDFQIVFQVIMMYYTFKHLITQLSSVSLNKIPFQGQDMIKTFQFYKTFLLFIILSFSSFFLLCSTFQFILLIWTQHKTDKRTFLSQLQFVRNQ